MALKYSGIASVLLICYLATTWIRGVVHIQLPQSEDANEISILASTVNPHPTRHLQSIVLKNLHDSPVDWVLASRSCGCVNVSPTRGLLVSGESVNIAVEFSTPADGRNHIQELSFCMGEKLQFFSFQACNFPPFQATVEKSVGNCSNNEY